MLTRHDAARAPEYGASAFAVAALDLLEALVKRRATGRLHAQHVPPHRTTINAGRRLNAASGLLAASVLADSAIEHYRGAFENRAMYIPLVTAALGLLASGHGVADRRPAAHGVRDAVYAAGGVAGLVGTGFHIYNVTKRPGGISWLNLFYGAPLGAPMALLLSGLLGFAAERVRDHRGAFATAHFRPARGSRDSGTDSRRHARDSGRGRAAAFPRRLPKPSDGAADHGTADRSRDARQCRSGARAVDQAGSSRLWLRLTAALGIVGVGFHAFGVSRAMGGWRNWSQNLLNGPPLPAPPSFTGLAIAGLAALHLLEGEAHD